MPTICLPDDDAVAAIGELAARVEVLVWDGSGSPPPEFAAVEFWVPPYMKVLPEAGVIAQASRLAVIQLLSAGVEPWLDRVPPGVTLCSGRGIHGSSTAELAVAGLLSIWRELPRFLDAQREQRWQPAPRTASLDGAGVLVLGAGDIGRRVATALGAFDAEITLVARRARDGIRALDELPALLPHQDAIVVCVPHTPQTHHLVDAAFLAALPAGHPLWTAPNVLITPHVGGGTVGWARRAYRLAGEQIARWLAGEPLHNVVDAGY